MKITSRHYSAAVLLGLISLLGLWVIACLGCTTSGRVGDPHQHVESWYANALADEINGKTEVRMRNGTRCDILTTRHAMEVDFAPKWAEAVGQSLNYASQTGRRGGIALILESPGDERHLDRLRNVITWHQLPISVVVLRPFGSESLTIEFPDRPEIDFTKPVAEIPSNYQTEK